VILEVDCGNTRIKWRIREGESIRLKGSFLSTESFEQIALKDGLLDLVKRVLVSSILGDEHKRSLAAWSLACLGLNPEFAVSELSCNGVINGYQQPEKLGVDRWLGILAAKSRTVDGCVIVDCGSAITVDLVTSKGEHLGGYIAPGLRLMREALNIKTAGIKFGNMGYSDGVFPGRNTVGAIKAAELAMITGLVDHANAVLRNYDLVNASLYITGGDGEWLSSMLVNSIFIEDLVLDGLSIALGH
jgi:type III pantothenate kinase